MDKPAKDKKTPLWRKSGEMRSRGFLSHGGTKSVNEKTGNSIVRGQRVHSSQTGNSKTPSPLAQKISRPSYTLEKP